MRFHAEASRDAYDAIVIGSGLGGLTTAGFLARAGRRVLVVERHDRPGGYAHAFRRRGYHFDSAVHLVGGCAPVAYPEGGLLHNTLETLGVRDQCHFLRVDPAYRIEWPGMALSVPGDLHEFVEAHSEQFPREAKGIRGFVQDCLSIRAEAVRAEQGVTHELWSRPERFPLLLRYRRATLDRVLTQWISDPEARAALAGLWPYLGLPPSRVSFLYFAAMLMSYVADGSFYCRGTFQSLADAMASALVRHDGELLLRSLVRRILVEDGRVAGVVLENGQRISAPLVVSNADARQTFEELVGLEHLPSRFLKRLHSAKRSISGFVVYAGTSLDLTRSELAHETFLYEGPDHDAAHAAAASGGAGWVSMTAPTLVDPSLAPDGRHVLTLTTLVETDALARWGDAKERITRELLQRAERRLPGLSNSLVLAEGATPRTLERYTRNEGGALYGFDVTPGQTGPGRLDNRTPIRGLFLAGHWTRPGGGVTGVVRSGIRTARMALSEAEDERAP